MSYDELRILRETRRSRARTAAANGGLRIAHKATVSVKCGPESNQSGIVVGFACKRVDGSIQSTIYAGHLPKNRDRVAPKRGLGIRLTDRKSSSLVSIGVCGLERVEHRRCQKALPVDIRWAGRRKGLIANRTNT